MVAGRAERAYLRDYATMMEAVPFPSLVFDHRWDVVLGNSAFDELFQGIGPHPTAMPRHNFLRFVLFHPDAGSVLADHETSWCLPMLAQFAAAMDAHGDDQGLQDLRRDITRDPIMDAAYQQGLPRWVRSVGADVVRQDAPLRPLHHPDSARGRTLCRVVSESSPTLEALGFTRMTLVLREPARVAGGDRPRRRSAARHERSHLRTVPAR
ncbi:hypothetical protein GCM10020367_52340 [Streptomyces sannanensis]|uniref:MmyB-like transcription regulator ligand binding domain-containing protein n=1 Tax=Streptomyces sannanensis TaxID=285536 RepID=A0ABP6SIB2_9ACTN